MFGVLTDAGRAQGVSTSSPAREGKGSVTAREPRCGVKANAKNIPSANVLYMGYTLKRPGFSIAILEYRRVVAKIS